MGEDRGNVLLIVGALAALSLAVILLIAAVTL
jgi:hypothetical protein